MAGVTGLVAAARAGIENLRPLEVLAELANGDVVLVDVREADETRGGVIEGAVLVPRGVLEFHADSTSPSYLGVFDGAGRVIVYCADGSRSALAARTLQELGYRDVAHMEGGFAAWTGQGGPFVAAR